MAEGYSFWLAAAVAYFLFFLVNGSLAYHVRARQFRERGKRPPPFLGYLFFPKPIDFRERIEVPRAVRLLLGVGILVGGVGFVVVGFVLLANLDLSQSAHPLGAVVMLLAFSVLGLAIAYVGWRLMVARNEDALFGRSKADGTRSSGIDAG